MCTKIKCLIAVIVIIGHGALTAHAAEREHLRNNYPIIPHISDKASPVAKERVAQVAQRLGLSKEETLRVRRTYVSANGDVTTRYRQMYRGIPVIGDDIIITRRKDNSFNRAHGFVLRGIANDLVDVKPAISKDQAMQIAKQQSETGKAVRYKKEKSRLAIWQNKEGVAKLVYEISFMQYGETPSRPYYIIDAKTGEVLKYFDNLQTANGTGPGGNEKTGQYYYGIDFDYLNVTQSGSDCIMENADVKTVDLDHMVDGDGDPSHDKWTAFTFPCFENTYKFINGAYSPINDAHYFGGVVTNMYKDLLNTAPLTFPLVMKVHYGTSYENAFWESDSMIFGDGANAFYPLVSLDIAAHEVSHGFTEQNSGLVYAEKSGGLNEAFSDMSGEAAEYYLLGTNDWMVGEQIKKYGALRYMNNPTQDGQSIDHKSDYDDSLDVHHSSGVYNKAFYNLATSIGWDTLKAFEVYATANMLYWTGNSNWVEAGNGVMDAACDLGYDTYAVKASLAAVGIDSDISAESLCNDYLVSVTPEWQKVIHGESTSYDVTITSLVDLSEPITINVETSHPDITVTVADPVVIPPANGQVSTTFTVATAVDLPRGSYTLTVKALNQEGTVVNVDVVTLQVLYPDVDITVSPALRTIGQGMSAVFDIALTSIDGFSSTFNLSAHASDPTLLVTVTPGSVTVPADGSVNATLTVDTSPNTPLQQHAITLTATDGEHTKSISGQLQVVDIDLTPTALSVSGANMYPGEEIEEVQYSITNQGSSATIGINFGVGVYLSTDATITTEDRALTTISASSLSGGATRTYTRRTGGIFPNPITMPSDIEPGTYYLGVIADYLDTEPEVDESNNTRAVPLQVLPPVDLTMTDVSTPSNSASTGESITVNHSITNQGGSATTTNSYVGIYLSTDATITTADNFLTSQAVSSVAAGETLDLVKSAPIPADLAAGTYYLGVIADFNQRETEVDESNNSLVAATQLEVVQAIDLTMTALSTPSSSVSPGDTISVSHSITNQGSSTTTWYSLTGLYLSTDATITTADTLVQTSYVFDPLAGGETLDRVDSVTIPANLAAGTYYLGAIADYTNNEPESNEGNNTLVAATPLQIEAAPVDGISAPAIAVVGTPVNFDASGANAPEDAYYYWLFGDATSAYGYGPEFTTVQHTYNAPGTYTVTLWINFDPYYKEITINP